MRRLVLWAGTDAERWEIADLDLTSGGVRAAGTQAGTDPEPYRLDYELDASDGFVTRSLEVEVTAAAWSRHLRLMHDGNGKWGWEVAGRGSCDLPAPGAGPELVPEQSEARDCDLGLSPLTNLMPVRRHELHRPGTAVDVLVVWVSVPDLGLRAYRQRYEHVGTHDSIHGHGHGRDTQSIGYRVRFVDLGLLHGFTADLTLDADGLVVEYPELARRAIAVPG